jgi:3-oxoacyl-[acyl-carrier protein] reductase
MSGEGEDDSGRVALVTGGNRGIGLACAKALAETGHRVAVTYRRDPPDDPRLLTVACDVTDPASVEAAFGQVEEQLGPVEVLVAAAGINADTLVLMMKDEDFTRVLDANLTGAFRVAKRAAKRMLRARWGRIILISSASGQIGTPGQANYAASKAGLLGFARSFARELAPRGITVNVVSPGPIDTDMLRALDDDRRNALTALVPLGRVGEADEVAGAVTYLASDAAGYITGVNLPVDGGLAMGVGS